MGDRAAERRLLRALGVDVDPLVVAGDVGERVDVLLGDLVPVGGAERPRPRPALSSSSPVIVRMARTISCRAVAGPLLARRRARTCSTAAFFALPDSITSADGQPGQRAARLGQPDAVVRRALRRRAPSSCASAQEAADYRIEAYPAYHAAPPADARRRWPTQWDARAGALRGARLDGARPRRPRGRRPDALARAAPRSAAGGTALILTGDRDMFQCATDERARAAAARAPGGPGRDRARTEVRERYGDRARAGAGLHRAARRPVRRAAGRQGHRRQDGGRHAPAQGRPRARDPRRDPREAVRCAAR